MTTTRTRRAGTVKGLSLYTVALQRLTPTFSKGDGKDGGRNMLAALLIGPMWDTVGYVLGHRGTWCAYTSREWLQWTADRRRKLPASQLPPGTTVDDAAQALVQAVTS